MLECRSRWELASSIVFDIMPFLRLRFFALVENESRAVCFFENQDVNYHLTNITNAFNISGDMFKRFKIINAGPKQDVKYDCKSTSGGLQFLRGKLVSWSSKKQDFIAMSTAKAEYVSLSARCAQVIWMPSTHRLNYGNKYNGLRCTCDPSVPVLLSLQIGPTF
ncbi:hypothetical protein Tco_0178462 [Tanacetum coccineum]